MGHLPFLDRLASLLVQGREDVTFRNGDLVVLSPTPESPLYHEDFTIAVHRGPSYRAPGT